MRGGGARGLALLGAYEVLNEFGFVFDTFIGTSAGAILSTLLAANLPLPALRDALEKTNFRRFLDGWFPPLNFMFRGWFHPGNYAVKWLSELFYSHNKVKNFRMQDLEKRARILAAGPATGKVIFDKEGPGKEENVALAVRYSMSIPFFFQPKQFGGCRIYDGGMLANFPIQEAIAIAGPSGFIGLYLGADAPISIRQRWLPLELVDVWLNQNESEELDRNIGRIIGIDTDPITTFDFDLSKKEKRFLTLSGRVAALRFLNEYGSTYGVNFENGPANDLFRQSDELDKLRFGVRKTRLIKRIFARVKALLGVMVTISLLLLALYWGSEVSREYVNRVVPWILNLRSPVSIATTGAYENNTVNGDWVEYRLRRIKPELFWIGIEVNVHRPVEVRAIRIGSTRFNQLYLGKANQHFWPGGFLSRGNLQMLAVRVEVEDQPLLIHELSESPMAVLLGPGDREVARAFLEIETSK